jgi:hypothetical protein
LRSLRSLCAFLAVLRVLLTPAPAAHNAQNARKREQADQCAQPLARAIAGLSVTVAQPMEIDMQPAKITELVRLSPHREPQPPAPKPA